MVFNLVEFATENMEGDMLVTAVFDDVTPEVTPLKVRRA